MTHGAGVTARTVDAGEGLSLHVECSGTGPPVLLLHGFTGDSTSWRSLASTLEGEFTVLNVDLPGHGRSGAPTHPARYHLLRLATDLTRALDELGHERTAVLGYSLGGRAALRLALEFPGRVSALILESTSPGIRDSHEREARAVEDARLADAIERDGVSAFVERWEQLPLWESQRSLADSVRRMLRDQRLRGNPVGLANSLRGAGAGVTEPVHEKLDSIGCPTLLVAGELDSRYVIHSREMASVLSDAEVETVPFAGHTVHLEQPEAFERLALGFLRSPRVQRALSP